MSQMLPVRNPLQSLLRGMIRLALQAMAIYHSVSVRLSTVLISWFTQQQSSSVDTEQQLVEL
jgi:hypothetical protein